MSLYLPLPLRSSPVAAATTAATPSGPVLFMEDFRHTASAAYEAVDVPDSVIDLLTGLRNYLQVGGVAGRRDESLLGGGVPSVRMRTVLRGLTGLRNYLQVGNQGLWGWGRCRCVGIGPAPAHP